MKINRSKIILLAAFAWLLAFASGQRMHDAAVSVVQAGVSSDSRLKQFDIAPGTLSPAFSPDVLSYTSTVDAGTTSVQVQAVPRAQGGSIAYVKGNRDLQPGVNTIEVACSAPDNTFSVYTITLTVGGTGMDTQPEGAGDAQTDTMPDDTGGEPQGAENGRTQEPSDGAQNGQMPDAGDSQGAGVPAGTASSKLLGPVAADGSVTLNGAAYKLSNDFSYSGITQDIPEAFGQGSLQIGGTAYSTLYYEAGGIHLVYMQNTDGNGSTGFYYYDEMAGAVERFKYASIGENFVVFISTPRQELPAGYKKKTLKLPSGKKVIAYKNKVSAEMKNYYLVYGINSDGSNGWYLYDKPQGTYMRYVQTFTPSEEPEDAGEAVEHTVSLKKYSSLKDKYTELKDNMVKAVSALTIALLVMIIVFTAILLRGQENKEEEADGPEQERRRVKKTQRAKKPTPAISKSSLAAGRTFGGKTVGRRTKKVTKTIAPAPEEEPQRRIADDTEHITSPEEIRAQMSREQELREQELRVQAGREQEFMRAQMSREQELRMQAGREQELLRAQMSREQELRMQAGQEQELLRTQMGRGQEAPMGAPGRDPMDEWEVEGQSSRKSRFHKKKRSLMDEDMEIMDLNDL